MEKHVSRKHEVSARMLGGVWRGLCLAESVVGNGHRFHLGAGIKMVCLPRARRMGVWPVSSVGKAS